MQGLLRRFKAAKACAVHVHGSLPDGGANAHVLIQPCAINTGRCPSALKVSVDVNQHWKFSFNDDDGVRGHILPHALGTSARFRFMNVHE